MKHYITDREAQAVILLIENIGRMVRSSQTIAAMSDIKKRDVDLIADISKRLKK
jgi:hypothetical protein